MCGPSSTQQQLQGQEQSFMDTLMSNYGTNFAEQQSILNHLNSTLAPIVGAGPNQTGFSPSENAALNTQAIDTTGAATANADRAVATETAGRNDSGNNPQSGVDQALEAGVKTAGAGELASEQLGITEANYATGRSNFNNAVAAEEGVAGQFNPSSTGSLALGANAGAFGEASTINQEQNQEEADIAGGVTSLASQFLPMLPGAIGGGNGGGGGGGGSIPPEYLSGGGGGGGGDDFDLSGF
jgi:hypothetical protein